MNNNLRQILRQSIRIAMGATLSCIETLQDPRQRAEVINLLQTELNQKIQEWSAKGEVTEAEVKAFIDHLMAQRNWQGSYSSSATSSRKTRTSPQNNSRLQELTQEIIALKLELERLRKSKGK